MKSKVFTGIDVLTNKHINDYALGNVGLLCHNASVNSRCEHTAMLFKKIFKDRFKAIFGPQHGFNTDAQDNMIETDHTFHPFFKIPIYSLYSETRIPTKQMLKGIDLLFVDLQDIGCRMYTYIYTLILLMKECVNKDIKIIVLDRPNPINGVTLEGNMLESKFNSFIGMISIPVRHGMTIGEVATMYNKYSLNDKIQLDVIPMEGWERYMYFEDTGLPWVLPSPNISRPESAKVFPGTVLFEGTNLSEGRGTTHSLEIIGHPKIDPFSWCDYINTKFTREELHGVALRPVTFKPTFDKHFDNVCGGYQMHVLDRTVFSPWKVGQVLLREIYHYLGDDFQWLDPPFEYDYVNMPIDVINGTDKLRAWVESNGSTEILRSMENYDDYKNRLETVKLY